MLPSAVHCWVPPLLIKSEQSLDMFLGRCSSVMMLYFFHCYCIAICQASWFSFTICYFSKCCFPYILINMLANQYGLAISSMIQSFPGTEVVSWLFCQEKIICRLVDLILYENIIRRNIFLRMIYKHKIFRIYSI